MSEEVKEKKKRATGAAFTGNGMYMPGVPARDLSLKEWKSIPAAQREHLLKLGLYEVKYD